MYGVFILVQGSWKLHATYVNKDSAKQEVQYLVEMLGLKAGLFYKAN